MIKLSPNTMFSYSVSKGTAEARAKLAERINDKVFKNVLDLYGKKGSCGLGSIKQRYNLALPERKNVNIVPLPVKDYEDFGGGMQIEDMGDRILGYSIQIPVSKKRKMNILDLPEFMHESTHVLDYLLNPRYISNTKRMYDLNIFDKEYFSIYEKLFDNPDAMFSNSAKKMLFLADEKTREAIKDLPFKEKITFLKYIKYNMQMEDHAYNQDLKFAKLMKKLGRPTDSESLQDYASVMHFRKKIGIVNNIIQEELAKARVK